MQPTPVPIEKEPTIGTISTEEHSQRIGQFTQFRDHLWSLRQSNIEHSDNLVLTLSAGILGLSVSFVKDIVPLDRSVELWQLLISWWLFSASILFTLVSYWFARQEMSVQEGYAYKYYIEYDQEYFEKRNGWKIVTEIFNILSTLSFTAGVVLLVLFVSTNLPLERRYLIDHQNADAASVRLSRQL